MRLNPEHISAIRTSAAQLAGNAAQLSARLAAQVSRATYGRKVDVLIKAPNLMHLPIHSIALAEGIRL